MPTILDFQIQPLSAESYSLTVCERNSSQPLASATFSHRVDFLTDFSVDRLNASTKDAAERLDELQKLGRELYQKLFPPAVEQVWHEYKQRSEFLILCLRFAEAATKLEVLPWETLHDGAEFIAAGAKTTLTRLPLDAPKPNELPPIPRPLKLFGFFASPLDLQDHERLNAEREQEILLEAINDPAAQGRISADFEDEAKLEILARSLRAEPAQSAQSSGYHILHFTGHGISPRDGGGLLLEDAHGKKLPASIAEVMQAVASGVDKLRLAVISGCQTARTLHTGAFNDLARELLRQRVPAVIAMQFSISDEGGLKFAEVLYREIAKGVALERAVHTARRVLLADQRFFINNDALAIVLLAADGACLQTTEAESPPPQAEPGATYLGDRLDPLAHGFYGRRREYRKIRDALLHQDQRAVITHGVIIHGMGGIGKTALLTHAINRLRPRFKDVMSFDCRRAALAPETILLELHRYFATQGKPQLQSLTGQNVPPETLADEIARMLTEWPLLIVFDNFESQLDEQREFINEDLRVFLTTLVWATARGSRFLFTTRYLFDLDGKRLGNLQELPLGDLSRPEALMLMQKLPNLAKTTKDDKQKVIGKFGCHPFSLVAVEKHCQFSTLAEVLDKASRLHTELREYLGIELNYASISDRSHELLYRLAAFRKPVPTEAAGWVMSEKISRADELDQILAQLDRDNLPDKWKKFDEAALRVEFEKVSLKVAPDLRGEIRELIEWGLLTPVSVNEGVQGLAVHSLVREFCRDRQAVEHWRSGLREAAAFYTNFIRIDRKDPAAVWTEMEAFELLVEAEEYAAAARLLGKNTPLLERWGFGRDLESSYRRLLNKVSGREEAMILYHLAKVHGGRGEYGKALQYNEQSRRIDQNLGNRTGVASSLYQLGISHQDRGEYGEAQQCYEQSLRLEEELSNRAGVASSLHSLGMLYQQRGEYSEAQQRYEQSLRITEELGDREGIAISLHSLGNLHYLREEYDEAQQRYEQSLRIAEELGDREGIANSLHQLGNLHYLRGEYSEALQRYERSLRINEALGNRAGVANSLHQLGMLYQQREEYGEAQQRYEQSLRIKKELGDREGSADSLAQIGNLFTETGRYEEAFKPLLNAMATLLQLQSPNVRIVVTVLRTLRARWGERLFDAAWRATTGGDVPEWLQEVSGAKNQRKEGFLSKLRRWFQ